MNSIKKDLEFIDQTLANINNDDEMAEMRRRMERIKNFVPLPPALQPLKGRIPEIERVMEEGMVMKFDTHFPSTTMSTVSGNSVVKRDGYIVINIEIEVPIHYD